MPSVQFSSRLEAASYAQQIELGNTERIMSLAVVNPVSTELSLDEMAAKIKEGVAECDLLFKRTAEHAVAVGELLIGAKARVGHGKWRRWVEGELGLKMRSVQGYMKLARQWTEVQEWAKVSGFKLDGTAAHKVLTCWKESKFYRKDDYESAMMQTQAKKPVLKAMKSAQGAAEAVGKNYPWNDVKPDAPDAPEEEPPVFFPRYIKLTRLSDAKHLLWQAAELLSNAHGESYLSETGVQSLEALISEVEQLYKGDS